MLRAITYLFAEAGVSVSQTSPALSTGVDLRSQKVLQISLVVVSYVDEGIELATEVLVELERLVVQVEGLFGGAVENGEGTWTFLVWVEGIRRRK